MRLEEKVVESDPFQNQVVGEEVKNFLRLCEVERSDEKVI
jgi:hypothetical protein